MVASRVFEFLQAASKMFDISVCSLGEQSYVDMVVQMLNQESKGVIRGVIYSARGEYLHLASQPNPNRSPKDLNSLFAYHSFQDPISGLRVDPIVLDDNASMWPASQQDNIIVP